MKTDSCYSKDLNGGLITAHAHFEGRCVIDAESDPLYADRLKAYREGGWPAWDSIYSLQREQGLED